MAVKQIEATQNAIANLVVYVGDTVADMLTVLRAREYAPSYKYLAVGVIPPHISADSRGRYADLLQENGADIVLQSVLELTPQLNLSQGLAS
jgi:HAD superfamily phosphatase